MVYTAPTPEELSSDETSVEEYMQRRYDLGSKVLESCVEALNSGEIDIDDVAITLEHIVLDGLYKLRDES